MCGISGVIASRHREPSTASVHRMVQLQHHRGPDHSSVERFDAAEAAIILGHNRLSIIDVSELAHQPIFDESGRYGVILNGEIYNFVELREELKSRGIFFRSAGDTEVVANAFALWGPEAIPKFNGMFALAICDRTEGALWLIRDRFGVKPLYYTESDGQVLFASTTRALAEVTGAKPDLSYLARGIASWNFESEQSASPYEGIHALPPGHFLQCRVQSGRVAAELREWYSLGERAEAERERIAGWSLNRAAEELRELLRSSVELRLRADVPIAVSLSGGLDSITVAALAATQSAEVHTFTYGSLTRGSEAATAQSFAMSIGANHRVIDPPMEQVLDSYWRTLEAQDAPFVSGAQAMHYLICEAIAQAGFKVVLGGQGGDEVFMGYRKYLLFALQSLLRERKYLRAAGSALSLLPSAAQEFSQARLYWRHRRRFAGESKPALRALAVPTQEPLVSLGLGTRGLAERQAEDIRRLSLPTLLRYEDRNTMAHSLEGRLPFLDYRVVELGLASHTEWKVAHGYGKWMLRQAVKGLIPEGVRLARAKSGFTTAQETWISAGLGSGIRKRIAAYSDLLAPYIQPDTDIATAFSDEVLSGDARSVPEALAIVWLGMRLSGQGDSTDVRPQALQSSYNA